VSGRWTEKAATAHQRKVAGRAVPRVKRKRPKMSALETALLAQVRAAGLPEPVLELRFHETRKWRFDQSWPAVKVACEVQGGVHLVRARFYGDMEKRAAALLAGWRVLEVGPAEIKSGQAVEWLRQLLARAPA